MTKDKIDEDLSKRENEERELDVKFICFDGHVMVSECLPKGID